MTSIDRSMTIWMITMLVMVIIVLPATVITAYTFEKNIREDANESLKEKGINPCVNCAHCIKAQLDYQDRIRYLNANRGKPVLNGTYWLLLKENRANYEKRLSECPK